MNQEQRQEAINKSIVIDHPDINRDRVRIIETIDRVGRCFELTGKVSLDNPTWIVVHTIISTGSEWIDHAYLCKDGIVYDPINDQFYDEEKLNKILLPKNPRRYASSETDKLKAQTKHWGPWGGI